MHLQQSTTVSRRNINFYYLLNDWRDQPLHFAIVFQSPWRTWNQEQICRATIYLSEYAVQQQQQQYSVHSATCLTLFTLRCSGRRALAVRT